MYAEAWLEFSDQVADRCVSVLVAPCVCCDQDDDFQTTTGVTSVRWPSGRTALITVMIVWRSWYGRDASEAIARSRNRPVKTGG